MSKLVHGSYAAVITPRSEDRQIAQRPLAQSLNFLLEAGIEGFAINGATGEFPLVTEGEFRFLMASVAESINGRAPFLAGIGAGSAKAAISLGKIAIEAGAIALLLPMPGFFPYAQDDLQSFVRAVATSLDAPILLYNLPQFTSGLDAATTLALVKECPNIIGTKDSSGSLETFRLLRAEAPHACCIVGNDGALVPALKEGLADGVVSGVACVLPELICSLFENGAKGMHDEHAEQLLQSFIEQLDKMPTPWGLKVMAEARGIASLSFPFPLSERRRQQMDEMKRWYAEHGRALCEIPCER